MSALHSLRGSRRDADIRFARVWRQGERAGAARPRLVGTIAIDRTGSATKSHPRGCQRSRVAISF